MDRTQTATERIPRTDAYKTARPVVLWVLGSLGVASIGIAGWAHATLWGHENTLQRHGEWQRLHSEQHSKDENRLDRRLDAIDAKLDRLLLKGLP